MRRQRGLSLEAYSRYCAPTALASLLRIPRIEAARWLRENGYNPGHGPGTAHWQDVLRRIGGVEVDEETLTRPGGRQELARQLWRYSHGYRRTRPNRWLDRVTVAQFRARHRRGTFVLYTLKHTLLVRNGRVAADTRYTKSARARVCYAFHFPNGAALPDARQDMAAQRTER